MEVLLKIGIDAGKLRDVKPLYARRMIDAGEAIDPNAPLAELADGGEVAPALFHVGERAPETILPASFARELAARAKKAKR